MPIADYYAIIGVGDTLERRDSDYDDAAFLREIVGVSLVHNDDEDHAIVRTTIPTTTMGFDGSHIVWKHGAFWDADLSGRLMREIKNIYDAPKKQIKKKPPELRHAVERKIKGFLSFSRDEQETPAVEDSIQPYYVKVHRRERMQNRSPGIAEIRLFFVSMEPGLSFHETSDAASSRLSDTISVPDGYDEWIVPQDATFVRQTPIILQPSMETQLPKLFISEQASTQCIPLLAIRHQKIIDRYHDDPAIVEIGVSFYDCHQTAVIPEDLDETDPPWENSSAPTNDTGTPLVLVRRNIPQGIADTPFSTSVIGRFPYANYKYLPLPEEELPMFCYPTGCRLHRAALCESPLPQYYGFCVKNEQGDSIYVSCVSFMEPLTRSKQEQLDALSDRLQGISLTHAKYCETKDQTPSVASVMTSFDDMTTFENKTICLVSRDPFWSVFRKLLAHLHTLIGTVSDIPIERWISHLLLTLPLPEPGGATVVIPTLLESVTCSLPPEKDFPMVDLPYSYLFSCLEIKTVVTIVLGLLALERKVVCISQRPSLVLDVCELLRSLLFPFELCAPYVPRLTEPFKSSLDFPGAIFVGIHDDGEPHGLGTKVKQSYPEESIVVDLDTGNMDCAGDRYDVLSAVWDLIPKESRSTLVSELEALCRDAKIVDGQEPLDSLADSAFLVDLPDAVDGYDINLEQREPLDDRAVRDAFLRFFCSVLGGYERFLVVPDADFLVSGNEWFDAKGFLASVPAERASYLGALVSTQLFQSFIQKRTEASDIHCILFDECLVEYHSTTIPYGRLGGDMEEIKLPDGNGSQRVVYSLLIDQAAKLPILCEQSSIAQNRSMDGSDAESSLSFSFSKASVSVADSFMKGSETTTEPQFIVSTPCRDDLPTDTQYTYLVDGIPCFPHILNEELFLPKEPASCEVELSQSPAISLTRSEKELEEANRRARIATAHGGIQNQRRCLWQLPKLMGSHFLGAWLMCIPSLVSQPKLSDDQQAKYLLRALGALRLLRSRQRIVPDEAAYRAMMVACGRCRSDRRVELVKLFGLLRSDSIFPNAVTLGQYTKALAEGYSKRSSNEGEYGVEVSASGSKIGMGLEEQSVDLTTRLHDLDASLSDLETHGKRWRQKYADSDEGRKRTSKPWLPVTVSSSFEPNGNDSTEIHLIAIWSRTCSCSECGYVPLEEEIQAGWEESDDSRMTQAVPCPRCETLLVPMLGYRELKVVEALASSEPKEGLPPQLQNTIDISADQNVRLIPYMNPSVLRRALESLIEEHGEEVLERDRLRNLDHEIFFNLWWYCARFSLPLPLPATGDHYCLFAAWDRTAALRGCWSAAKVLAPLMEQHDSCLPHVLSDTSNYSELYDDIPFLARFNLQGFYASVWDDQSLSQVLVTLVEACDKRDFRPVVQLRQSYATYLYLAKYQCTSAFHTFFPAVLKPCKGYHFWCSMGSPMPMFDRLLREADPTIHISELALGFRCVFGHLI